MTERDWDKEQHRLLNGLNAIDMHPELRLRLDVVVRQWIGQQQAADRRWRLHQPPVSSESSSS